MTVMPGRTSARPGDVVPVAVIFDHKPKWHTQAGKAAAGALAVDPDAIATTVSGVGADSRLVPRSDALQWPTVKTITSTSSGAATATAVFEGRAIVYVPVEVAPGAERGNANATMTVSFQACDEKVCLSPVEGQTFDIAIAIDPSAAESGWTYPELFAAYRPVAASLPGSVGGSGIPPADAGRNNLIVILTGVLVAVGVVGTVVIGMMRRRDGAPQRR